MSFSLREIWEQVFNEVKVVSHAFVSFYGQTNNPKTNLFGKSQQWFTLKQVYSASMHVVL